MVATDFAITVLLLGKEDVGKSSLAQTFVEGRHDPTAISPTVEDMYECATEISPGRVETLHIEDIGGGAQPALRQAHIRRAQGFILVYDITDSESFRTVIKLRKEVEEARGRSVPIYVVGNKLDLEGIKRQVFADEVRSWALTQSATFYEVSARTGANASQPFVDIARAIASTKVAKRGKVSLRSTLAAVSKSTM
ncbi:hypothetical protein CAOG_03844 [Capsaspora owczarzaki ATCC 30864]|uniref:Uncharacterized protein n=1 Tax=Capsaspora owczarzaki (strain ATCC 30864) TaxID=595528 RepID=A0A0D2UD36_CAPO3|nr:hypothetical protein CAOG_03844 [Capsaspora owczarzaki ATCC 30864]KJE92976.1 hypothetical protein CAOG_003844 [Capsaspora owczarzaki ATCC 30864]|eukprot:XP_004363572.1 hypothetical protein CAOG_03844 [Capsaspora owczarzaki ATCC 30864]